MIGAWGGAERYQKPPAQQVSTATQKCEAGADTVARNAIAFR
jgi:hypothetical protein